MKKIIKLSLMLAVIVFTASCAKEPAVTLMEEVTYVGIDGTWKVQEIDGVPMADGLYVYTVFDRKDHTFTQYLNLGTMYAHKVTGHFTIEKDLESNYKVSGSYDYDQGDWSCDYQVTEFNSETSMVWIKDDGTGETQKLVRCEAVPDEVLDETMSQEKD